MRILFDALLLVSQAADILYTLADKKAVPYLTSLLMAASSFWAVIVTALRWRLEANSGTSHPLMYTLDEMRVLTWVFSVIMSVCSVVQVLC